MWWLHRRVDADVYRKIIMEPDFVFLPVCLSSAIRCLLLLFQALTAVAAVDATKIAFHNINEIME